ncbi:unnamed protein product [Acanthosepion pharaonis]|uniref:Uncharacterized protein n=1 Tax=Acanthosepion pharaonis TaxID=158019 RepID=A0A812BHZ5_ACAPH|nr:unnamed protein product [Sepia pharaonis]
MHQGSHSILLLLDSSLNSFTLCSFLFHPSFSSISSLSSELMYKTHTNLLPPCSPPPSSLLSSSPPPCSPPPSSLLSSSLLLALLLPPPCSSSLLLALLLPPPCSPPPSSLLSSSLLLALLLPPPCSPPPSSLLSSLFSLCLFFSSFPLFFSSFLISFSSLNCSPGFILFFCFCLLALFNNLKYLPFFFTFLSHFQHEGDRVHSSLSRSPPHLYATVTSSIASPSGLSPVRDKYLVPHDSDSLFVF